jgi:hypothetical protein
VAPAAGLVIVDWVGALHGAPTVAERAAEVELPQELLASTNHEKLSLTDAVQLVPVVLHSATSEQGDT